MESSAENNSKLNIPKSNSITETDVRKKHNYYAVIPQDLIRDRTIPSLARLLFGILHSFAKPKNLEKGPKTYVSQKKIAEFLGCTPQYVSIMIGKLKSAGWINVRKGLKSNTYTLLGSKRSAPGLRYSRQEDKNLSPSISPNSISGIAADVNPSVSK